MGDELGTIEKNYDSTGGRVALRAWDIWVEIWEDGACERRWGGVRGRGL